MGVARSSGQILAEKYRLERLVDEGGMGAVWAAEHVVTRRHVALKFLKDDAADEGARKRFLLEARASCAVDHPAVVPVMDVLELDGELALVMELLSGESLAARLDREGRLSAEETAELLLPVAEALAAAHALGIVHRDLKPSNIFLTKGGRTRLLDFGIAKLVDPGGEATQGTASGAAIGTPRYMSPEQAFGEKDIDHRTDVWSLGLVLYQCLSGTLPTEADSFGKIVKILLSDAFPPLGPLAPDAQAVLVATVERMLVRDRSERLADLGEVARVLRGDTPSPRTVDGRSLAARSLVAHRSATTGGQSWRGRWLASVGVVLVGGVALGVARYAGGPSPTPPESASSAASASAAATSTALEGSAVRMIDLPLPKTNDAALTAYKGAMSAYRDGAYARAAEGMESAVKLDPGLAAAHLRLAIWTGMGDQVGARAHFGEAQRYRDTLTPRDRGLLEAFTPMFHEQTMDLPAVVVRLERLVRLAETDAELWLVYGWYAGGAGMFERTAEALERAVQVDPGFGEAHSLLGFYLPYVGRDGKSVLRACLQNFVDSSDCRSSISFQLSDDGDCEELLESSRQAIRISPNDGNAYAALARALVARGADGAAVREVLAQKERASHQQNNTLASPDKSVVALYDEAALRILAGDFTGASSTAAALWKSVDGDSTEPAHMAPARRIVELQLEMGRVGEAGAFALDYERRRSGWGRDVLLDDWGIARDPLPLLFSAELRSGKITEAEHARRHGDWLGQWERDVIPGYRRWVWPLAYATTSETKAEAEAALKELERFAPIPSFRPASNTDGDIGRVYYLAGRPKDALPWLERAAKSCWALDAPIAHTRAHYFLGLTREALGDEKGACEAYAVVKMRWGKPKGRSVTWEATKKRIDALECRL